MATFSFKKEARAYIVYLGNQYNIDISDISFGQNFSPTTYSTRTLQNQNLFDQYLLTKANPANFSFTCPAIRESDLQIVFNRALDARAFDFYISTQQDVFKVENCVITNAAFIMTRNAPLGMQISGEGSRLTRAGTFGIFTIPGTIVARSNSRTYNRATIGTVSIGGITTVEPVVSSTVELQNKISWLPFDTVSGSCSPIGIDDLLFPSAFIIESKILAGTLTSGTIDDSTWSADTTLRLQAGQLVGTTFYGFDFNLANVSFTSRTNTGDVFSQSYDWRLIQNPTSLLEVISYVTIVGGTSGALLDSVGLDILDSDGLAILETL